EREESTEPLQIATVKLDPRLGAVSRKVFGRGQRGRRLCGGGPRRVTDGLYLTRIGARGFHRHNGWRWAGGATAHLAPRAHRATNAAYCSGVSMPTVCTSPRATAILNPCSRT